jgi:hypothetical protein
VAHFGPEGVVGKLKAGPFEELADALLTTVDGRNLAVRLRRDGSFRAGAADVLPPGQFVASTLMSDQQQRRQDLYRAYLKRPITGRRTARLGSGAPSTLMVWAKPIDMHFTLVPGVDSMAGMALLVIPLQVEASLLGQRVTVPGPFSYCRRDLDGVLASPPLESSEPADMHLRFQLPAAVLPLTVERARFVARIDAPSRRVTISGRGDGGLVEVHRVESPLDPIRAEITDKGLLRLDDQGGLHLNVAVSGMLKGEGGSRDDKWTIQYLELEVTGVTK